MRSCRAHQDLIQWHEHVSWRLSWYMLNCYCYTSFWSHFSLFRFATLWWLAKGFFLDLYSIMTSFYSSFGLSEFEICICSFELCIILIVNAILLPSWYLKPMALDQVLSDRDSEDEVDDDIADFEDRRVCLVILSDILWFCS